MQRVLITGGAGLIGSHIADLLVEREVREMIGISDAVLYNWTGQSSYDNAIRKLMEEVIK